MDKYTKFILTVIAVLLFAHLLKGEKIISPAHAVASHNHYPYEIWNFVGKVEDIVESCGLYGQYLDC